LSKGFVLKLSIKGFYIKEQSFHFSLEMILTWIASVDLLRVVEKHSFCAVKANVCDNVVSGYEIVENSGAMI